MRNARQRNRRQLQRLRTLRQIIDSLPDAAMVVNAELEIVDLNDAAVRLLDLNRTDRGQNLASLVRQPEFIALIKGQVDGNLAEFVSPRNDATRMEARRVTVDEQQALILVRDVTQLNRLLSMRQDFIANVSHELRTPLTVIVGYVETLLGEQLDAQTATELIRKLRSPLTRMRALVDDLLLLTRLESSPNPDFEELTAVDMKGISAAVAADARALSSGHHDISLDVRSTAQVLGIESELLSACLNLATNAVRYSPDGGEIRITWEDLPQGGARFAVADQGMGIPEEHLSRITERFYRVDFAKSRVRGGTGLGLAIVKHVLKRHNTELKIASALAEGSTFYCDFPEPRLRRQQSAMRNQDV